MTDPLWKKPDSVTDSEVMDFLAGDDVRHDALLFPYDLEASRAHARGLARIGILDDGELQQLEEALGELQAAFASGEFVLDSRFEDGHSAIEYFLTEKLGATGKKIHTGRSRNDQVLVATRLFVKAALKHLSEQNLEIAAAFLQRARQDETVAMPGQTHLQHAVVSSAGLWFAAYAEAFLDNADLAAQTLTWLDQNPLGTAAGFGVNLPLDRAFTTAELGFARMQVNPMYTQNSRGKFELQALMAHLQAALDLRRFAWDLSLYCTPEFGFVRLPESHTTGSSIMPNKRNPDVVELLRAEAASLQGALVEVMALLSLPAGYHRDLQHTKAPMLRALPRLGKALALLPALVRGLDLDRARMEAAIEPEMFATDAALEQAAAGIPFREAYQQALADKEGLAQRSASESLAARVSPGGTGALCLGELERRLREASPGARADSD